MGRLKGLTLSLLLGLYASPPTPVEQELHQYLSRTQAAYLALCLQHAQHLVVWLACPCVFLQVLIYLFLGGEGGGRSSRAPLHFLSPFPLLSSSAPRLPCSYRRQCRITVRELTVTGSPTAPAASPLLPQSSGPGTGIS